ncbi:hypothetical protein [Spirosoma flavus]
MQKILNVIMVISAAFSLFICFYKMTGNDSLNLLNTEASSVQVKPVSSGDGVRPQFAKANISNTTTEKQRNNRIGI